MAASWIDRLALRYRAAWMVSPAGTAALLFFLGALPFLFAVFSPIGYVGFTEVRDGTPVSKSVGYLWALNWWPPLALGFPAMAYFELRSIQNLKRTIAEMVELRMFARKDWRGPARSVQPLIVKVWRGAMLGGLALGLLGGAVVILDWWCVVAVPYDLGMSLADKPERVPEAACPLRFAQENDWSVAALFPSGGANAGFLIDGKRPDPLTNELFALYVYLLLAVHVVITFAYYCFIASLSVTLHNLENEKNIRMVPNIKSPDPQNRMGFESFESVFGPCVATTFIAFVSAYLMRLQNIYLRDNDSENIFAFAFGDFGTLVVSLMDLVRNGELEASTESLVRIFDLGKFQDPNSFLGLAATALVFSILGIAFYYVLCQAAKRSAKRVDRDLQDPQKSEAILDYYGFPAPHTPEQVSALRAQVNHIEVWPLSWPRLRQARNLLFAGVIVFVFFRLVVFWLAVVVAKALVKLLFDKPTSEGKQA